MPSERTIRTRDPHKPITPEILELFDRSKQLFEMEARDGDLPEHLRDELADIEKKLTWTLLPRIFGEHWGSHVVDSPAHPSYDGPCYGDEREWALLQEDRANCLRHVLNGRNREREPVILRAPPDQSEPFDMRAPATRSSSTFAIAWPRRYLERCKHSTWLVEAVRLERKLIAGQPRMQLVCRLACIDEDTVRHAFRVC